MKKENYFKGFRKSPKQLLTGLKKYLKEVISHVEGYMDTCEYHLELEKCKSADDYADVQCICENIVTHLDDVVNILEEDGLNADVDPYTMYESEKEI